MESLALYTARNNKQQQYPRKNYQSLYCDFCNMKGHVRADCNKLKKCDHCHATRHVRGDCYQLIGYPDNFKGKKKVNAVLGGMQDHLAMRGDQVDRKAHMGIEEPVHNTQGTQEQILLQLLHKSSPDQINTMIDALKRNSCSSSSVNMAGDTTDPIFPILHSHVEDCELTLCSDDEGQPNDSRNQTTSSVLPDVVVPAAVVRKSNRPAKPLLWHTDYVLSKKLAGNCLYPIGDVVDYERITPTYKSF
ncbi:hypothetical protein H5410_062559, partial [Solanum commersonii]